MFTKLGRAVLGVVTLPVDIVADVITLGGSLTDRDVPYTARKAKQIMKNLDDATKAESE